MSIIIDNDKDNYDNNDDNNYYYDDNNDDNNVYHANNLSFNYKEILFASSFSGK